jgi:hypothetical protein
MNRQRNSSSMEVNGLFATINTPEALKGEGVCGLPPHAPVNAYVVDEYPACPETWMHGSAKASSYFCPVDAGKGMWFDFTANQSHKHHIAVVVSVQGINPVDGRKITALNLEQYKTKCPKHNIDFVQDRFCTKCKHKWPAQSYIATTTGQTLWIDGFRNEKGEVRQYVITEEEASGVAAQLIGEDRVFAIGFAFYKSKILKPKPVYSVRSMAFAACAPPSLESLSLEDCAGNGPIRTRGRVKNLEIAAGARINQEVGVDPEELSFWEDEPTGLIYVNYVPTKIVEEILAAGKREEAKDGFLAGLKVG